MIKRQSAYDAVTYRACPVRPFDTPDMAAGEPPPSRQVGPCTLYDLRPHWDARGGLCEFGRASWLGRIDQVYASHTEPDTVKGWHLHREQIDRFVCVAGSALVCVIGADDEIHEVMLRSMVPQLLVIPPGTPHGWYARDGSTILNLCSHEYDGTDEYRADPQAHGTAWDWRARRDG